MEQPPVVVVAKGDNDACDGLLIEHGTHTLIKWKRKGEIRKVYSVDVTTPGRHVAWELSRYLHRPFCHRVAWLTNYTLATITFCQEKPAKFYFHEREREKGKLSQEWKLWNTKFENCNALKGPPDRHRHTHIQCLPNQIRVESTLYSFLCLSDFHARVS